MLQQVVVSISIDQAFELFDGRFDSAAAPAVRDSLWPLPFPNDRYTWYDVGTMQDRRLHRLKMIMHGKDSPMGFDHQRKSMVSIAFRKCAVDCDGLAAPFNWRFSFFNRYGHVSVHDQPVSRVYAEFLKNLVAEPDFMNEAKIGVFCLMMWRLVDDEITFKGRNAILTEKR